MHTSTNWGASPLTITQQYEYDNHALKSLYHTIKHGEITYPKERLATYQYNEIGQMINKSVGNAKIQSIDYTFNIRGALTRINEIDSLNINDNNDLFAFQLVYEDQNNRIDQIAGQATNGLGKRQYNGLIAGQLWQSKADGEVRGYAYAYDGFGRLKEARYKNFNTASPEKFSVSGITYDKNGNITKMKREGMININLPVATRFGVIDDLTYIYKGNQITNIKDNATASTGIAGDFQDRDATSPTATEYFYDENGNLITDDNKKVITLIYTAQGKVSHVKYADNSSITYTYDAVGIKLQKIAENVPENKTINTLYVGGLVYQGEATTDGELQFIATPEGKALAPRKLGNVTQAFAYEYNYTDHLGNLRMTFRESKASTYEATMETTKATTERREFANIDITRNGERYVPNALGRTKSAKVQASTVPAENKSLGPWKSIPVVKGDKITVNVQAYTEAMPQNSPSVLLSLASLISGTTINQYGTGADGKRPFNPAQLLVGLNSIPLPNNLNPAGDNLKLPNAYLRIIEYDENGVIVYHDHRYVSLKNTWHPLRIENYTAQGKGHIEVFVANESGTAVWFDEMSITHTPTLIAQETHYDPWGLELVGIGAQGYNRFTFNAQSEKQKELGGNTGYFFETDWRGYDAQVGRFWQVDKLASMYHGITPYHFALNNPISKNDPTGLAVNSDPNPKKDRPIPPNINFDIDPSKRKDNKNEHPGSAGPAGGSRRGSSNVEDRNMLKDYGGIGNEPHHFIFNGKKLYYVNSITDIPLWGIDALSGKGKDMNDPQSQGNKNTGTTPTGTYSIYTYKDPEQEPDRKGGAWGKYAWKLHPGDALWLYNKAWLGRDHFYLHEDGNDNEKGGIGTAGCIGIPTLGGGIYKALEALSEAHRNGLLTVNLIVDYDYKEPKIFKTKENAKAYSNWGYSYGYVRTGAIFAATGNTKGDWIELRHRTYTHSTIWMKKNDLVEHYY